MTLLSEKIGARSLGLVGSEVVPSLPPSPACLGNFSVVTLRNVKEHEGRSKVKDTRMGRAEGTASIHDS